MKEHNAAPALLRLPAALLEDILLASSVDVRGAAYAALAWRGFRDAFRRTRPQLLAKRLAGMYNSATAARWALYQLDGLPLASEDDFLAAVRWLTARAGTRRRWQPLHGRWYDGAGKRGHTRVLAEALAAGEPPANFVNTLRLAATEGHADAVRLLLAQLSEAGVPVGADDTWHAAAAAHGHTAVLGAALDVARVPPGSMARALRLASRHGHVEAVRLLLERGAPAGDADGVAWFEEAAEGGHTALVQLALDQGEPAAAMGHALYLAAAAGKDATVRLLLEAGAPVDARNRGGEAWYLPARRGGAALMQLALQHGAPPAQFESALEAAARRGQADVVLALLRAGVRPPPHSNDCYVAAAGAGHAEVLAVLLDSRSVQPRGLASALREAAERGHAAAVRVLLERGVPAVDSYGRSWYEAAATYGHVAVLELALGPQGIAPTQMACALELAVEHKHAAAARLLLARGVPAPPAPSTAWCKDAAERGRTEMLELAIDSLGVPPACLAGALLAAVSRHHVPAARLLLERGAPTGVAAAAEAVWVSAARMGREDMLQLALEVGVPGSTLSRALGEAAAGNQASVVRLLLAREVPPPGPHWLEQAARSGFKEVLAVALEYGFVPRCG